jgi:hypothetical protein
MANHVLQPWHLLSVILAGIVNREKQHEYRRGVPFITVDPTESTLDDPAAVPKNQSGGSFPASRHRLTISFAPLIEGFDLA